VNLLGRAAQVHVPDRVRRMLLRQLFRRTAAAFDVCAPDLSGLSSDEILTAYARFTASAEADSARLLAVTFGFGKWLRRAFGVNSTADVMAAARIVYRAIGIDFAGDSRGDITISRCFFSDLYTLKACRTMSALDAGLLAGLSGGGRLTFSQRITAGFSCCRAQLLESA
jgi:hypothetical protein